jgi:acyl-homoserine lactone acylase PvdQ
LEKLNSEGDKYLVDGSYFPCEIIDETIKIKNSDPFVQRVLITKHGPILSTLNDVQSYNFSFQSTWLKPKPINGFFKIHGSMNVNDVRDLFKDWPFVSTNLVMADTDGNISWQLCGETPERKQNKGLVPQPGWVSDYDWENNNIIYSSYPYLLNPSNGFIATANNKITQSEQYPYFGRDFIDGYRHSRIIKLLQSMDDKWNINLTHEMQLDQYSEPWNEIKETILKITPTTFRSKRALEVLRLWDGEMRSSSVATTIHELFIAKITKAIINEFSPCTSKVISQKYNPAIESACFAMSRISQVMRLIREKPTWIFNGDWDNLINDILDTVIVDLENLDSNVSSWEWGKFRPLILKHSVYKHNKDFRNDHYSRILNLGPIPWGGNEQTVNVAAGNIFDPSETPSFIPNLQSVMDVGHWDNNIFCLAGGQNENPASKNYRDLFDLWSIGKGITIFWNKKNIDMIEEDRIILTKDAHLS